MRFQEQQKQKSFHFDGGNSLEFRRKIRIFGEKHLSLENLLSLDCLKFSENRWKKPEFKFNFHSIVEEFFYIYINIYIKPEPPLAE